MEKRSGSILFPGARRRMEVGLDERDAVTGAAVRGRLTWTPTLELGGRTRKPAVSALRCFTDRTGFWTLSTPGVETCYWEARSDHSA